MSTSSYNGDEIAIIGMALRVPGANDVTTYWQNLAEGRESLSEYSRDELIETGVSRSLVDDPNYVPMGAQLDNLKAFDAPFFGMNALDASFMDPQHRHFLELCWEAFEHAGEVPSQYPGATSVYAGSGQNTYLFHNLITQPALLTNPGLWYLRHIGNDKDFLATRASYQFDLKGASVNIQTACSTFLVAAHAGIQALLNRECDMAVAGGVSIIVPQSQGYLYQDGGIQDPTGHCRAFDQHSKGTVFGSGGTVVVLKRLEDAINDNNTIHAIVRSSAVNNDGAMKAGFTAPSVDGQVAAVIEALDLAEINPESIGYMEAHGTGTPMGDPIEVAGLTQAWQQSTDKIGYCALSSVKSNIGHLDSAAGGAGFIKIVGALSQAKKYPTVHFTQANPALGLEQSPFYVSNQCEAWAQPTRLAAVSAFGVGGTNAHMIAQSFDQPALVEHQGEMVWLPLSAKTSQSLEASKQKLADYIEKHQPDLKQVSYTLCKGRELFEHRCIVKASSLTQAVDCLRASNPAQLSQSRSIASTPEKVTFVFTGQGSQFCNMGQSLYEHNPVFRQAFDECAEILLPLMTDDIRTLVFVPSPSQEDRQKIDQTSVAQPVLFSLEYALTKAWEDQGIIADELIGHSIGEYVAAVIAGVFTLKAALALVVKRGTLMQSLPAGKMLAVQLSEKLVQPYLNDQIDLAGVNGEGLCVLSGAIEAIENAEKIFSSRDIGSKMLVTSHAFHSMMMEPILAEFEQAVIAAKPRVPNRRFISNVSGDWITPEQASSATYWSQHLRQPVRFAAGISTLVAAHSSQIFIEIGAGNSLARLINQHSAKARHHSAIASLPGPKDTFSALDYFTLGSGRLWCEGKPVDLLKQSLLDDTDTNQQYRKIPLPTYSWDHKDYWVEPGESQQPLNDASGLEKQDFDRWFYQADWRQVEPCQPATTDAYIVLLVQAQTPHVDALIHQLTAKGGRCIIGEKTTKNSEISDTHYQYNAFDEQGIQWLLSRLESRAPSVIIDYHCFESAPNFSEKTIAHWQRACFDPSFWLAKALSTADITLRYICLADTRYLNHPALSLMDRVLSTLSAETVSVSARTIEYVGAELASAQATKKAFTCIADDILSCHTHNKTRYNVATRYVEYYQHQTLSDKLPGHSTLKQSGTYLITGSRGVSLDIAKHLLSSYQAKVIIVSRQPIKPKEQWTESAISEERYQQLLTLSPYSDQLIFVTADVNNTEVFTSVLDGLNKEHSLNGIFHTAGVLDDGLIASKTLESARAVLAPKVQAVASFEQLLADDALDFLLLFSSVSSLLPVAGQVDYSAANNFLTSYAQFQNHSLGRPVVSINWGSWSNSGMAVDAAMRLGLIENERAVSDSGVYQLNRLTRTKESQWLGLISPEDNWLLAQHRTKSGLALIPGTGYIDQVATAFRGQVGMVSIELTDLLFMSAFTVGDNQQRAFIVSFSDDEIENEFVISSAQTIELARQGQMLSEHARGNVRLLSGAPASVKLDDIIARCNLRKENRHGKAEHSHLVFGERWRCVEDVYFGVSESLTLLTLHSKYHADLSAFPLHPAMLDMSIGNLQLIDGFDPSRDFYVPVSYASIKIYGSLEPKVYSHVVYKGVAQPDTALFDVFICNLSGDVILNITNFLMKKVAFDALDQLSEEPANSSGGVNVPTEPVSLLETTITNGIRPEEGWRAIEYVLNGHLMAQTVVCSIDLNAYENALSTPVNDAATDFSNSLPRPDLISEYIEPINNSEQMISEIWSESLGIHPIGTQDNFFELGGHSLLLTQVVARTKKRLKSTTAIGEFFEFSTIGEWAKLVDSHKENDSIVLAPVVPVDRAAYSATLAELGISKHNGSLDQ